MIVLILVLASWVGSDAPRHVAERLRIAAPPDASAGQPAPLPCRDRPLVDGELPIANGVVTAVSPTMFKVGSMTLSARMDSDAYRELLFFAREDVAVRVSVRLVGESAGTDPAATAVFDRTAVLEDLGLMSGRTLRPALARVQDVELMVYSNRCLALQILKWAGRRVQLIARYDRASSDGALTF